MNTSGIKLSAKTLATGKAKSKIITLNEPLSFWGGFDLTTGCISDKKHPQVNTKLTSKILVMPSGRGSSSASSVLAEAIRSGVGPSGIVLKEPDSIIALGAIVAAELYDVYCPVILLSADDWSLVAKSEQAFIQAPKEGHADIFISSNKT